MPVRLERRSVEIRTRGLLLFFMRAIGPDFFKSCNILEAEGVVKFRGVLAKPKARKRTLGARIRPYAWGITYGDVSRRIHSSSLGSSPLHRLMGPVTRTRLEPRAWDVPVSGSSRQSRSTRQY